MQSIARRASQSTPYVPPKPSPASPTSTSTARLDEDHCCDETVLGTAKDEDFAQLAVDAERERDRGWGLRQWARAAILLCHGCQLQSVSLVTRFKVPIPQLDFPTAVSPTRACLL